MAMDHVSTKDKVKSEEILRCMHSATATPWDRGLACAARCAVHDGINR